MKPLWTPSKEAVDESNLTRFINEVRRRGHPINDFARLYDWSITDPATFWSTVWDFTGIRAVEPYTSVLEHRDLMPGARWFTGAKLNFGANLLRFRDDHPAIISTGENGEIRRLSFDELYNAVSRIAAYLKAQGIGPRDRVAGYLPNIPETIIAMLAATSLGAIWSSCSPDFGVQGVLDRFGQIKPKVLFCANGYYYNGKTVDCLERVEQITTQIPSLERVVIVPYVKNLPGERKIPRAISYDEVERTAPGGDIPFAYLPFDHPLYIMYSSGTTGAPKCIVHGAGGTLIQHLKELVLHTDLKREDRIFYFTTCGWMMWNWLVSSLATGATVLLYDGSPFHPTPARLFDFAEAEEMTVFGTSAKYISAIEKSGVTPKNTYRLQKLRTLLSTGSPLAPESFDYVYEKVKADLCLSSISGGTDIISCFALGNPIAPVYRGELQTRGLGMNVQVFDEQGNPVVGKQGELVCVSPFPSMPVYFWDDPTGEKYHQSYFNVYPNIWRHGDYVLLTERGGLIVYGRSDAVLNPGGVRIGTAEIYAAVEQLPEVLESLVIGQAWDNDERVILFLRLKPGHTLDQVLETRVKQHIRACLTPRHVPAKIIQVADIPRTINGKITELAVKNIVHGLPIKNREALANPEALELFRDLPQLKTA